MIVTEVNLPELDGFELCRRIRSHTLTRHTPIIFHSTWDDYRERYLGLQLGADDYLSKGMGPRELLIRIQLVLKRYADVGTHTRHGAGLEGDLKLIGSTGLLQMCHLSRFSGSCTVRKSNRKSQIRFRDGEILSAESGKLEGSEAIFELLAWTEGRFEFLPGDPGEGDPLPEAFDFLLLEGCRRLDEERRPPDEP
jgi:DNA-binding response OmpR family regulator